MWPESHPGGSNSAGSGGGGGGGGAGGREGEVEALAPDNSLARRVSGGSGGGDSSGQVVVAPISAHPMIAPVPEVAAAALGGVAAQVTGLL